MRVHSITKATLLSAVLACSPAWADEGKGGVSHKMHHHMLKSAEKAKEMKMSGDPDKDFAAMMADHHRTGIEVAKEYSDSAKNPELRELAKKMIDDQSKELKTLERHS
jgi:uncharacterized protein (DUF305 family)